MRRPLRSRLRTAWLSAGVLFLAACATPPHRPPALAPSPPMATAPSGGIAQPAPSAQSTATISPWKRLRARFAMQGCDYRPEVQHWARSYTRNPQRFAANWERAMPFLLIVLDELERRDLPGEFAMLPYLESRYQPVATSGNRPAGMWQIMPNTARARGLAVGSHYDARLDALASTEAALDLLERYEREFADWRLADMAFNSGEFRVRKLLAGRTASAMPAAELAALPLNQTTHDHLDRLLALACIIDDPQRFAVTLPEPRDGQRLRSVPLRAGMDLRLAARLAGVPLAELKHWNAGYLRSSMPANAVHRLLLPASRAADFEAAAATVAVELWNDWHEQRVTRRHDITTWAAQAGVPANVLAMANAVDEQAVIAPLTPLLLPGREPEDVEDADTPASAGPRLHRIAPGDTLSAIAKRYGVSLQRLKRWNPQAKGLLRPGQRLRVHAVDG